MNTFFGLGGWELIMLVGMGIVVLVLLVVGAALVKLAFFGPASRRDDDESDDEDGDHDEDYDDDGR
ncbi:hypothetical protein [Brachybacterium sacelli]|uniref:Membrane protein n=1 Tax=Brachybacterium sacelli TaxID=173364 RepID=A0ABS4WXR4_9MICO|nr:hypothetical protein [Brachybacterium sacelli]MBP2380943.1 putative membrane protein [Brachybacterium sacelli]